VVVNAEYVASHELARRRAGASASRRHCLARTGRRVDPKAPIAKVEEQRCGLAYLALA
jgi:hypothetical protein